MDSRTDNAAGGERSELPAAMPRLVDYVAALVYGYAFGGPLLTFILGRW